MEGASYLGKVAGVFFAENTEVKNGKEAIFYGLSGVPAFAFIAGWPPATRLWRAPPIPAVPTFLAGMFFANC